MSGKPVISWAVRRLEALSEAPAIYLFLQDPNGRGLNLTHLCSRIKNVIWIQSRLTYRLMTDNNSEKVAKVAFSPIIMAPPNDHSTIYTSKKRMPELSNIFGTDTYTRTLHLTWVF